MGLLAGTKGRLRVWVHAYTRASQQGRAGGPSLAQAELRERSGR